MAKNITFCGVSVALSVLMLMLTNVLPFNTAVLVCGATVVYPLVKIKCGGGYAFAAFAAGALLSFILLVDKFLWAGFLLLALYSVIKGYIERIVNLPLEILAKAAVYTFGAVIMFSIFRGAAFAAVFVSGAAVFAIYDIFLSFFITFIRKKLRF